MVSRGHEAPRRRGIGLVASITVLGIVFCSSVFVSLWVRSFSLRSVCFHGLELYMLSYMSRFSRAHTWKAIIDLLTRTLGETEWMFVCYFYFFIVWCVIAFEHITMVLFLHFSAMFCFFAVC